MTRAIEFHFDFVSPYSYLACTQLPQLARQHGAEIVYKPFRLLELMKLVGNRPTTIECENKNRYAFADLGRWAAKYGVSVHPNPHLGKIDTARLLRGALIAADDGNAAPYVSAVFGALWIGERDLSHDTELVKLLKQAGLTLGSCSTAPRTTMSSRSSIARRRRPQSAAYSGRRASSFGDELFFGNDRLDFAAAALAAAKA